MLTYLLLVSETLSGVYQFEICNTYIYNVYMDMCKA